MLSGIVFPAFCEYSFDFGIAPHLDATFDLYINTRLNYKESFFSKLNFEMATGKEEERESSESFEDHFTFDNFSFVVDTEILGYIFLSGPRKLSLALSLDYYFWKQQELLQRTAYEGESLTTGGTDLRVSNDQVLQVLLPSLNGSFSQRRELLWLDFSGELAPAVLVNLKNTADSDPLISGFNDNGPLTSEGTYFSNLSFSIKGVAAVDMNFLFLSLESEYAYLPIKYSIATINGIRETNRVRNNWTIEMDAGLSFISFKDFSPMITTRFERSWTYVEGNTNTDFDNNWTFFLGARKSL